MVFWFVGIGREGSSDGLACCCVSNGEIGEVRCREGVVWWDEGLVLL